MTDVSADDVRDPDRWACVCSVPSLELDRALLAVRDGKHGLTKYLALISGLAEHAVKSRIARARQVAGPERVEQEALDLDDSEVRYREGRLYASDDPAVAEWLGQGQLLTQARPDWRGKADSQ